MVVGLLMADEPPLGDAFCNRVSILFMLGERGNLAL